MTPDLTKAGWREKYIEYMVTCGVSKEYATECYEAADEYDFNSDPERSAQEEMSYWEE